MKEFRNIATLDYGICDIEITLINNQTLIKIKENEYLKIPTSNLHNVLMKSGYKKIYPKINQIEINRIYGVRESVIQSAIISYLENMKYLYFFKTMVTNKSGVADIIICYKGKYIAIEIKRNTTKGGVIQNRELLKVINSGGVGRVVRSIREVKDIIKSI